MSNVEDGGNKVLARTIDLGRLKDRDVPPFVGVNLVYNALFEHMGTEHANGISLHTNFSPLFEAAPGWYTFGAYSHGSASKSTTQANNPFKMKGNGSGVLVVQNSGKEYGICQPLLRAAQLAGRRVRVSGCYEVKTNPGGGVHAGVNLFLVSKVNKVSVDPDDTATIASDDRYWTTTGSNPDTLVFESLADLRHVVRVAPRDSAYDAGEELLNRAFDWWDVFGAFPTGSKLYLGSTNAGSSDAGGVGTNGETPYVDVYYLGEVDGAADGTGTSGMMTLATSTALVADGLQYFETYVDIPADMFTDSSGDGLYQDGWLVLLPVHPDDQGSMAANAEVRVWALSVEPVVEDAAGKLLFGPQLGGPSAAYGMGMGGFPQRHLLRYPIYVPTLYPLDVHGLTYNGGTGSGTVDFLTNSRKFHPSSGYFELVKENIEIVAAQAVLPPGSSVLKAAYHVYAATDMQIDYAKLYHAVSYDPQDTAIDDGVTYANGGNFETVVSWGSRVSGTAHTTDTVNASRNRMGLVWPRSDTTPAHAYDGTDDAESNFDHIATVGASCLWFLVKTSAGVNTGDYIMLKDGWILAAVDPRWTHAQWKRSP